MSNIRKSLIANTETDYVDNYKPHCLKIYKLYVEKADSVSARLHSANSCFLTRNTAIIDIIGYFSAPDNYVELFF